MGRIPLPNWMNFRKSAIEGGGAIFNPKIYVADFGNFKPAKPSQAQWEKQAGGEAAGGVEEGEPGLGGEDQ